MSFEHLLDHSTAKDTERTFSKEEKTQKYCLLVEQVKALVEGEVDLIANMSNIACLIHHNMGFWWAGFYRVQNQELVLGPFQGTLACTRIAFGKGVCGTAWRDNKTLIVADVERFAGHIACSSATRSEIVVPLREKGSVIAVLDIDSQNLNNFDEIDAHYLELIAEIMLHHK